MSILKPTIVAALLSVAAAVSVPAQEYAPRDSVTVAPNPKYSAGLLRRFFFGPHYRKLWATPIRVPVLRLKDFAGGLKPSERGGGMQTKSLRLRAPDGREFQFRSIDKDPTPVLPPDLRETIAKEIFQDQISATHPGGALIVVPLLEAAGILHPSPRVVQMADDPDLGEYRQEFSGLLGTIEERPRQLDGGETFAGASDIVGTEDLLKKLDEEPWVRTDARAFLLARLLDVFVGDWDRHADQWRWALVDSGGPKRWLPIPRDRDQAFVRYDGFLLSQARRIEPKLINFGDEYDDMAGSTWNGRDLDRRFLAELERPVWDSVTAALKASLTDAVITRAARAQPPEFHSLDARRLERDLRARRDQLERMAAKYYRMLAHQVEVYASDKEDLAVVDRQAEATVVTLSTEGKEYFRRRFTPAETQEIRIHLLGDGDALRVQGVTQSSPRVRVIGGGGDDVYTVNPSAGIHLYDERGQNRAQGAGINTKEWQWKPDLPAWQRNNDSVAENALPPRDWGRKTVLFPSAGWAYDMGVILGFGGFTDWFAFRRAPYSTRLSYRLEVATQKRSGRATLGIKRRFENSRAFWAIETMGSGIETLRWYGFGNETVSTGSVAFHRVTRNELVGELKLGRSLGRRGELSIGPIVRWSKTDLTKRPNSIRFIGADAPYGTGEFGMVGGRLALELDSRDYPRFASRGASLMLGASGYPKVWDADEAVARVEGEGSLTLAPSGRWQPSLNLMAGGVKTWGKLPYFLAPTLGGLHTLRGYRPDRFAGDAAVYGSADLRIPLTRLKLVIPGQQGVFGFFDAGRVYLEGETSDTWHSAFGGGIWFTFLTRDQVGFVGAGKPTKDKEGTRLIVGFGFPY